jgi:hypothetical protein
LDFNKLSPTVLAVIIIGLLAYTAVMSYMFVKVIASTDNFSSSHVLISALALLTFVSLTAAVLTSSVGLETIAATGVGAIAGAVSHKFISVNEKVVMEDDRESVSEIFDQEDHGDVP